MNLRFTVLPGFVLLEPDGVIFRFSWSILGYEVTTFPSVSLSARALREGCLVR